MIKNNMDRIPKTEKNKGMYMACKEADLTRLEMLETEQSEPIDPEELEPLDCMLWEFPEG